MIQPNINFRLSQSIASGEKRMETIHSNVSTAITVMCKLFGLYHLY